MLLKWDIPQALKNARGIGFAVLEEHHGQPVCGESRRTIPRAAGSYRRSAESPGTDLFLENFGQAAQIRRLPTHDEFRPHPSGGAVVHGTGFAGSGNVSYRADATLAQQLRNIAFDLRRTHGCDAGREILYRPQISSLSDQPHANLIQPRIEDISAVRRRMHPLRLERRRVWRNGEVFRDHAKMRTFLPDAGHQISLSSILVG
jgi:hypothetical protein